MPVKCGEVIREIEKKYPLNLAEDWDNVGLIIGDYNSDIKNILVCLEINDDIINEAIEKEANMIITHHPLIFKPFKKLTNDNHISLLIMKLVRANINVYTMHTNFDNAKDGMNDIFADLLELQDPKALTVHKSESLYKLVVFVPLSHANTVREAILNAGAGHIGDYSHCSFILYGTGTFKPLDGTTPFIGKQGEMEKVNEVRIETIVDEKRLSSVIAEMLRAHPYEEVAYDIYPLKNKLDNGTGRYGKLTNTMNFRDFCDYVKQKLNVNYLNVAGDFDKQINNVAIVGGAGADFAKEAIYKGCDVLITGDVKHHSALDAVSMGINIIDAGHFMTEVIALPHIADFINSLFSIDAFVSGVNTNPFKIV
jgi:dinuclear metal center YbgI/SA1388 family protein